MAKIEDELELRGHRTFDNVKTDYLHRLKAAGGGLTDSSIGDLLGRSGTAISGYFANGEAPKVVELAARYIYERDYCPKKSAEKASKMVTAIVRGEQAHVKTVFDIIKSLGGDAAYIGDF